VLVKREVDVSAAEADALELEAGALFERGIAAQADEAAGAEDAMPGEAVAGLAEEAHDEAVMEGIAGGGGHLRIRSDLAARDGADDGADGFVARHVRLEAPFKNAPRQLASIINGFPHTPQQ
jgi:hypothetical protein